MRDSVVKPQALLGNSQTGYGGEPTRNSLSKFNYHDHALAGGVSFLMHDIVIGAEVTAETPCLEPLFPPNTFVVAYDSNSITISKECLKTFTSEAIKVGNEYIEGCKSEVNSNIITFSKEQHGFILGDSLKVLTTASITGVIVPVAQDLTVYVAPHKAHITAFKARCITGSCAVRPAIYNTQNSFISNLGLKSYGTELQTTLYDLQTVDISSRLNVGSSIRLLCSGITAQTVLFYQLDIQKVLEHHNG
jgi:hypothetical protein